MKNPWLIVAVVTVLLFGSAIWYSGQSSEKSNEGIEISQNVTGNPSSEIKLVEYSDFQCPACAAFHPIVKDVLDQFGEDISFEYKHFPLINAHPHAVTAAVAAEAAGQQGQFFEFSDLLFTNQNEWSSLAAPRIKFIEYAEQLGLDVDKFKLHLGSSMLRDKVMEEFNEGRSLDVTGTPTFFLNGNRMQYETYQSFIDQIALAVDPSAVSSSTEAVTETNQGGGINFGF